MGGDQAVWEEVIFFFRFFHFKIFNLVFQDSFNGKKNKFSLFYDFLYQIKFSYSHSMHIL